MTSDRLPRNSVPTVRLSPYLLLELAQVPVSRHNAETARALLLVLRAIVFPLPPSMSATTVKR